MHCNILAVGLRDSFLAPFTAAARAEGFRVIPASSLSVARWLLTQRNFSLLLMDLTAFKNSTQSFVYEAKRQSLPIAVLGVPNLRYGRMAKQGADRLFSYDTPPQAVMEQVLPLLCPADYTTQDMMEGYPLVRGDFSVDRENGLVNVCGKTAVLTPEELVLLCYFLLHARQILSYQMVCTVLWTQAGGYGRDESPLIADLRKKIEPDPDTPIYLQDVPELGYWFQDTGD